MDNESKCDVCGGPLPEGDYIVSGSGLWCSPACWESEHDQTWLGDMNV